MGLLELPLEIIYEIIDYVVDEDWLPTACDKINSLRTICKDLYWPLTQTSRRKVNFQRDDLYEHWGQLTKEFIQGCLLEKCRFYKPGKSYLIDLVHEVALEVEHLHNESKTPAKNSKTCTRDLRESIVTAMLENKCEDEIYKLLCIGNSEFRPEDVNTTILGFAATTSDATMLEQAIIRGTGVCREGPIFKDLLYHAVCRGDTEIVKLLTRAGANCDDFQCIHITECFKAKMGLFDRDFYTSEFGFEDSDYAVYTFVLIAARMGHYEITKTLLEAGAKLGESTDWVSYQSIEPRKTHELDEVLQYSSFRLDLIQLLLEHGSKGRSMASLDDCHVHSAAAHGSADVMHFMLDLSLKLGGKRHVISKALGQAVRHDNIATARVCLEYGADPDDLSSSTSPVHEAARNGNIDLLKLFAQYGGHLDLQSTYGSAPIHYAAGAVLLEKTSSLSNTNDTDTHAYCKWIASIEYLLNQNVEIDRESEDGMTALHFAAQAGAFGRVQYLVSHGADVHRRSKEGNTALIYAASSYEQNCTEDMIRFLLQQGLDCREIGANGKEALHYFCKDGLIGPLKVVLEYGADVNATCEGRTNGLHLASQHGHPEIVQIILQHDVDANTPNDEGKPPLYFALAKPPDSITAFLWYLRGDMPQKLAEVAQILLEHGADAKQCYEGGETLLHLAVERAEPVTIGRLVNANADLNARTDDGETPLMRAVRLNKLEAASMLVSLGADIPDTLITAVKDTANRRKFLALLGAGDDCHSIDEDTSVQTYGSDDSEGSDEYY